MTFAIDNLPDGEKEKMEHLLTSVADVLNVDMTTFDRAAMDGLINTLVNTFYHEVMNRIDLCDEQVIHYTPNTKNLMTARFLLVTALLANLSLVDGKVLRHFLTKALTHLDNLETLADFLLTAMGNGLAMEGACDGVRH